MTKLNALTLEPQASAADHGAKLLFFSGGSALRSFSQVLKQYTHNSIHIITPFDSGGSSAKLRQAFNMPAVGDIRARILALADENALGSGEIYRLANFRLPEDQSPAVLKATLLSMLNGQHDLVCAIPKPANAHIRQHLAFFSNAMPHDFDLRGASIGNLMIAGGYLHHQRRLEPVLNWLTELLQLKGQVLPVADQVAHLQVQLEDESRVCGQHRFTGKECLPLQRAIRRLYLSVDEQELVNQPIAASQAALDAVAQADLICYPPGSFYSSLIANLLPQGIVPAITASRAPKVYVPNLLNDPEQVGMCAEDSIRVLLDYLSQHHVGSLGRKAKQQVLTHVVLDVNQHSLSVACQHALHQQGVKVLWHDLVNDQGLYDNQRLIDVLLALQ